MHELLARLFGYVRGIWRYRWVALGVAWGVAIVGWIVVAKMPDRYQSSARVFVDTNSVLRPLLQGLAIQPDLAQRVELMSKMLLNQETIERVARTSDLDLAAKTDKERAALLAAIKSKIALQGDRANPSMYSVTFEHGNPEYAKRVVQALMDIFIDEALVSDQRANATAQDFLDQEIGEYERRLDEAERTLAEFKRKYLGTMPGTEGDYYKALETQKGVVAAAELSLREMKHRRDAIAAEIKSQEAAAELARLTPPTADEIGELEDPQIAELKKRLNILLLHYTEKHPAVIDLRRLIRELQQQLAAKAPMKKAVSHAPTSVSADTVYGSLRVALNDADAQVAALQARVEEQRAKVTELTDKIDSIPKIEAELKRLNRDYTTVATQHAELLERREAARLSQQVEKTSEGVRFRVIDPPSAPSQPSAPNRKIFNLAVLVVAIAIGMVIALLIDLLRPVFDDRRALYHYTNLPVFGAITLMRTHAQQRHERLALVPFFVLALGLFMLLLAVMTLPVSTWLR